MPTYKDVKVINSLKNSKIYSVMKGYNYLKEEGLKKTIKKMKNSDWKYYSANNRKILDFNENDIYVITGTKRNFMELKKSLQLKKFFEDKKLDVHYLYLVKEYSKKGKRDNILSYFDFNYNFTCKSYVFYKNDKKAKINYGCVHANTIDEIISKVDSVEGIKLYSNYTNKNNVSIKTGTFLSVDGKTFYSGGAERYLIDLDAILGKMNVNMNIYQDADFPMFRKYKNINVIGVPYFDYGKDYELKTLKRNMAFVYEAINNTQLTVYSPFFDCYPFNINPSVGISHGIAWDNKTNRWTDGFNFEVEKNVIIKGAQLCDKLVSVDTNTCNWFQTLDYDLGARKFSYLPNYVDIKEFSPREDFLEDKDKIILTYPRRLYGARGLYLLLNITEKILKKHKNVEIHFVGKGFDSDLKHIEAIRKKYPKNVFCYSKPPTEMPEVYKYTDISVIPTIMSEGTSLSCLEALASGNIVISTRIGGLPDLIINYHNGYLIEPNEDALFEAIDDAITNYKDRKQMRKNAIEVAKTFNKKYWDRKWEGIFNEFNLDKNKDKEVKLVEYIVSDLEKIPDNMKESMIKDLRDNKLIYLKFDKKVKIDELRLKYQGQRFQIIDDIDESYSPEHKTYREKDFDKKRRKK